jgi:hypothetical protein
MSAILSEIEIDYRDFLPELSTKEKKFFFSRPK